MSSIAMTAGAAEGASGARFGDFQVQRYLTAGGMADLYLVRTERSRDPLVLKCVQRRYLDSEHVVALFQDEAQIGSLLSHPNIVRVFETGQIDGHHYIVMEYIRGHDLVDTLSACTRRRLPIPREVGVSICAQVARGLAYIHELRDDRGRPLEIVHCDISPGNVMLTYRGAVKLVDFGVARARIALHCPERGVAGKYNYMAPEQIRGARIDRRADLFSLGVILWELTCGQRLFKGRPEAVMKQVLEDPVPAPRDLLPEYPAELQAIVLRALHRDPERRYPSAEALRIDLVAFLSRTVRPHGKRELARFVRTVFGHPPDPPHAAAEAGPGDKEETVDLPGAPPPAPRPAALEAADATTETELLGDREEEVLTRYDNPLLSEADRRLPPVRRDPDRTGLYRPARRRHHSGGITTHLLGEGRTHPRPLDRERPAPADLSRTVAIHFLPAALRRRFRALAQKRTLLPLFLMLLGLALAFYVALGG